MHTGIPSRIAPGAVPQKQPRKRPSDAPRLRTQPFFALFPWLVSYQAAGGKPSPSQRHVGIDSRRWNHRRALALAPSPRPAPTPREVTWFGCQQTTPEPEVPGSNPTNRHTTSQALGCERRHESARPRWSPEIGRAVPPHLTSTHRAPSPSPIPSPLAPEAWPSPAAEASPATWGMAQGQGISGLAPSCPTQSHRPPHRHTWRRPAEEARQSRAGAGGLAQGLGI